MLTPTTRSGKPLCLECGCYTYGTILHINLSLNEGSADLLTPCATILLMVAFVVMFQTLI